MGQRDPPDPVREPLEVVLPTMLGALRHVRIAGPTVDDTFDHRIQQLLAAGHVSVQRHRLDPQHRAKPSHRQAGQSLVVDERQSGHHDPFAAQRHPG